MCLIRKLLDFRKTTKHYETVTLKNEKSGKYPFFESKFCSGGVHFYLEQDKSLPSLQSYFSFHNSLHANQIRTLAKFQAQLVLIRIGV